MHMRDCSQALILEHPHFLHKGNLDWSGVSMPPFDFDLHISSQLTHAIFYSSCLYPHQNLLILPSISSHNPFEIKKQLIVYMETSCAMAFPLSSYGQ